MKKSKKPKKHNMPRKKNSDKLLARLLDRLWRNRGNLGKALVCLTLILTMFISSAYGISQWYARKHAAEPMTFGATFVPNYARYFELDPEETLQAMIDDLGLRRFRLVSYWKDIERVEGSYDFSELDWQFDMIEASGGKISLALGLRQPRWPECHGPVWAMEKAMEDWLVDLKDFMGAVIDRYKDRESLIEYQLENEFFLSVFGECPDFSRERLIDEYNFVRSRDPDTRLIISRSNNAIGIPLGEPTPDQYAVSVYKRVWDKTITRRYYEYPFPPWFYGFLAGSSELVQGKTMTIHELQTEAWLPPGYEMKTAPIDELYKSLNPERLKSRIKYGVDTGMRSIDLWGVEWWYHMKVKRNAPELWETAKTELNSYRL